MDIQTHDNACISHSHRNMQTITHSSLYLYLLSLSLYKHSLYIRTHDHSALSILVYAHDDRNTHGVICIGKATTSDVADEVCGIMNSCATVRGISLGPNISNK